MADSISSLAATITDIINTKVKESNQTRPTAEAALTHHVPRQVFHPVAVEGWVGKKELAEHFKISVRTTDNWMKSGLPTRSNDGW